MREPPKDFQVEGNQQCREFWTKWYHKLQEGKVNFIAVIACQSSTEVFTDHVGVIGTEFAANFGVDNLKMQIASNIFRRLPPPQSIDAPANKVVYNLASAPCSFDFLAWLVTMELLRIQEGAPAPLEVIFSMGQDQDIERTMVTDQRRTMYENVMKPLIPMIGAVETKVKDVDLAKCRWIDMYTLSRATELVTSGLATPQLTPSKEAVEEVERYLNGRKPITITLREATHWDHRNSVTEEWLKFADMLSGQGEDVLFVRDTAQAREPIGAYHTMPSASLDINIRVALYQRAKCNFFVGNGPATLAFFTSAPWFMFAPIDPSGAYPPGQPSWWKPHHGINANEQFPWSGPNQRIIWELDTFENMEKVWTEFTTAALATKAA